jgi:rhodanese-related sulfurtransferase
MVESMSVERLRERIEGEGTAPQIVDVRRSWAYRQAHLPGADSLPLPELPERVADHEWGEEIVCVCPKGESSLRAARLLESYEGVAADATVYNLDSGLQAWDGPVESGVGGPDADEGSEDTAPF